MELLCQYLAPLLVDLGGAAERRRPQLDLTQQPLTATVAELGAELTGERASVGLEVQLAAPHRHGCPVEDLAFDVFEEFGR